MKQTRSTFGSPLEAILYPILLLILLWLIFWAERVSGYNLVQFGVQPQHYESWIGVIAMPLLHSPSDWAHIINNSIPLFMLLAALIYYYREVALKVFVISWLVSGLGILFLAKLSVSYHIGISGVVYALFGFLLISGMIRRYKPLQAISLFVVFVYGSMIWGIFPQEAKVSWEGHLSGLFIGVVLAIYFRKQGPKSPKYQFEIEQELGIEPPDLEGIYHAKVAAYEEFQRQQELAMQQNILTTATPGMQIVYHVRPATPINQEEKPLDGSATQ